MLNQNKLAICVLTSETRDTILEKGGTEAWALGEKNARQQQFVVCIHRYVDPNNLERGHLAFLIGRLKDVRPSDESGREHRWKLLFSEFAVIEIPNAWPHGNRNPVSYTTLDQLGINFSELQFQAMPPPSMQIDKLADVQRIKSLSIAEAKEGLAATFGVTPSDIEITIRG